MSLATLRPRTFTELVDAAFAIFRDQYATLTAAVAVIIMPVVLLRVLLPTEMSPLFTLAERLLSTVVDGAVVLLVSERLLGRQPDLTRVLRETMNRGGTLIVASFLRVLAIFIGTLLLVIPGIWAYAIFFAMPMVVMLEDLDGSEAADRSRELARGHVWRILGVMIVGLSLLVALSMLGGFAVEWLQLGDRAKDVATSVIGIVAYPITSVFATLLYYDLRIRKEGFDLEMMAADLGEAPPVAASAIPSR